MAQPIKAELSQDNIPISYSSLGLEDFPARLTDVYDVVDVHFMPGVIMDAEDREGFAKAGRGAPGGRFVEMARFDMHAFSTAWNHACRRHYTSMLKRVRDYQADALTRLNLKSGKKLTAVITESFGPCFWPDHPDVRWDWYKQYNADALRIISHMDFAGTTLSNYAEPLFSLWSDVDWHRTSNVFFQVSSYKPLGVPGMGRLTT
jgi:hypothetical protein